MSQPNIGPRVTKTCSKPGCCFEASEAGVCREHQVQATGAGSGSRFFTPRSESAPANEGHLPKLGIPMARWSGNMFAPRSRYTPLGPDVPSAGTSPASRADRPGKTSRPTIERQPPKSFDFHVSPESLSRDMYEALMAGFHMSSRLNPYRQPEPSRVGGNRTQSPMQVPQVPSFQAPSRQIPSPRHPSSQAPSPQAPPRQIPSPQVPSPRFSSHPLPSHLVPSPQPLTPHAPSPRSLSPRVHTKPRDEGRKETNGPGQDHSSVEQQASATRTHLPATFIDLTNEPDELRNPTLHQRSRIDKLTSQNVTGTRSDPGKSPAAVNGRIDPRAAPTSMNVARDRKRGAEPGDLGHMHSTHTPPLSYTQFLESSAQRPIVADLSPDEKRRRISMKAGGVLEAAEARVHYPPVGGMINAQTKSQGTPDALPETPAPAQELDGVRHPLSSGPTISTESSDQSNRSESREQLSSAPTEEPTEDSENIPSAVPSQRPKSRNMPLGRAKIFPTSVSEARRQQRVSAFDSEVFDSQIYAQGTALPPPQGVPLPKSGGFHIPERQDIFLRVNPEIHFTHKRSKEWHKRKAAEIEQRPRRKAWFGKVVQRQRWLRQQRERAQDREASEWSGESTSQVDPEPWGYKRPLDFGLVPAIELPEEVKENPAWLRACARFRWDRAAKEELRDVRLRGDVIT